MVMREYSAGLMSQSFWFIEFKKMVSLARTGASEENIRTECLEHNLFGAAKEYRAKRMYGYLLTRLHAMDDVLLALFDNADLATQKLINLIVMMKTDRLLFEFVYEVYREKAIIGAGILGREDTNVFFTGKERQSEEIAGWKDTTKKKLGQCYLNFLTEANLLREDGRQKLITPPILDTQLQRYLEAAGEGATPQGDTIMASKTAAMNKEIIKAITGAA